MRSVQQKGCVIWFTGLSGAGKSTLANNVASALKTAGYLTSILDGDLFRTGISKDLGFSAEDRDENIRRACEVAKILAEAKVICMAAFISPFKSQRENARIVVGSERFIEVYMSTPLAVCEQRDRKGLYAKARAGKIKDFTGIDSPYEFPQNPEIVIETSRVDVNAATKMILDHLIVKGYICQGVY